MDDTQPKIRVNSAILQQCQGKSVCLLGNAHSQSQDGSSFKVTTSDGGEVSVKMNQPSQDYLQGLVEVYGIADGARSVKALHYIKFPPESSSNFDMDIYDKAVQFAHQYPAHYVQGVQTS